MRFKLLIRKREVKNQRIYGRTDAEVGSIVGELKEGKKVPISQ